MSTPPDQLPKPKPKPQRKSSVAEVLLAIQSSESVPSLSTAPKQGAKTTTPDPLEAVKKQYEADKLALESGGLKQVPAVAPTGLETEHGAVLLAQGGLPAAPKSIEDYVSASKLLAGLAEKVKLYLEAVAAVAASPKGKYEAGLLTLQPDLDKASAADTDKQLALEQAKAAFLKKFQAMKDLVKTDYDKALAAQTGVGESAKALNALVDKYKECKDLLYGTADADRKYLFAIERNSPPSAQTRDALAKYKAMMRLYHGGQYDACIAAFKELQKGIAQLKLDVAAADLVAQPKADAVAKKFEKLAGGKKLSTLNEGGMNKLVRGLKKLKLSEQTDMLADLHGPSTKLDAEGRLMQMALYKAMTLDMAFKKADQKTRDAYRNEMKDDVEIQDAVADWNKKDGKGQDVVSAETKQKIFEKVLAVQSKAYGIPVPAIRWYDGGKGDFGGFNTTSGIISLNTRYLSDAEEMINTILHENSHNYQDQLAKRFFAGDIKPSDPVYAQAKAFALSHHMDAYVDSDEDAGVYKAQPEEMHAWDAGDKEAPALMKGLALAKKKRKRKSK